LLPTASQTPVLEKCLTADAIILGSPIYFWDVTGEMRSCQGFFKKRNQHAKSPISEGI